MGGNYRANEKRCPFGSRKQGYVYKIYDINAPLCKIPTAPKYQKICKRRDIPAVQPETVHTVLCITSDLHLLSPGLGKNQILQRVFGIF